MKKILLFCTFLLLMGYGCSDLQKKVEISQQANNVVQLNTFRDARLLFQIDYPKNWVVTDYIDYNKNKGCIVYKLEGFISEKYGKDITESC